MWHDIRMNQMVSLVFILITRIVFCSTNGMSVAALNATTRISARHNILSARTHASYTVTFEAVAPDELQDSFRAPLVQAAGPSSEWICDRQWHPSHDHVDLAYELPLPGNCAKCRPVNLLRRCFRTESIQTEHILAAVCRRGRTNYQPSLWRRTCLGRTGLGRTVKERLPFAFSHECTCAVTSG